MRVYILVWWFCRPLAAALTRIVAFSLCLCTVRGMCVVYCSYVGLDWARYIVALGAIMGIITTTLVSRTTDLVL